MTQHANRVLIFANPIAGKGRARRLAERIRARLSLERFDVELCFAKPDKMPDSVCTDPAGNLAAIVIGGDGTLRAVATRLLRPDMPPLLVVPMGTANLMGKHLGIKWKDATFEDDVLRVLRH